MVTRLYHAPGRQSMDHAVLRSPVRRLEHSTTGYSPVDNTETISKTTEGIHFLLGLQIMNVCTLS